MCYCKCMYDVLVNRNPTGIGGASVQPCVLFCYEEQSENQSRNWTTVDNWISFPINARPHISTAATLLHSQIRR